MKQVEKFRAVAMALGHTLKPSVMTQKLAVVVVRSWGVAGIPGLCSCWGPAV